jgi:hypothetical protein
MIGTTVVVSWWDLDVKMTNKKRKVYMYDSSGGYAITCIAGGSSQCKSSCGCGRMWYRKFATRERLLGYVEQGKRLQNTERKNRKKEKTKN